MGIATVSISLLKDVTEKINPPRALYVPFDFGYPLGEPDNPDIQMAVICEALDLLHEDELPVLREFSGSKGSS